MKLILYLIGGLVLANIVAATFIWPPSDKALHKAPIVNAATRQGQDPWMVDERYLANSRAHIRKHVLQTLGKPWSTWCAAEGHQQLIAAIDNYYYQRDAEASNKANVYGEEGRRFAVRAWATTDDNRIERLVSETHDRGYFSLDELRPDARTALTALAHGAPVRAKPCAD